MEGLLRENNRQHSEIPSDLDIEAMACVYKICVFEEPVTFEEFMHLCRFASVLTVALNRARLEVSAQEGGIRV